MRSMNRSQLLVVVAAVVLAASVYSPLLLVPLVARPSLLELYGLQQHPALLVMLVVIIGIALMLVLLAMKQAWRSLLVLSMLMLVLWLAVRIALAKFPAWIVDHYPVVRSEYRDIVDDIIAGIGPLWGLWLIFAVFVTVLLVALQASRTHQQ